MHWLSKVSYVPPGYNRELADYIVVTLCEKIAARLEPQSRVRDHDTFNVSGSVEPVDNSGCGGRDG